MKCEISKREFIKMIYIYKYDLDGYDTQHIRYKWEDGKQRVSIGSKVKNLPQYNLTNFDTSCSISPYVIGKFTFIHLLLCYIYNVP